MSRPKFDADFVSMYKGVPCAGSGNDTGTLVFGYWDNQWVGPTYIVHINDLVANNYVTDLRGMPWSVHIVELLPTYEPLRVAILDRYYKDGLFFIMNQGGALWCFREGEFTNDAYDTPKNISEAIQQVKNYAKGA